jgi:UDP-N-acetylglucosamine diphosphorylase / glucose-1-phosphate thymidylyltransferase / UDP-N-acetylgalactosamine diphosphorylase / glucosamine-1-phosphate N-acetyltransferase / galactosamine-1-phosphate N-acetyltransferase
MKPVYLTDKEIRDHLYPFAAVRAVADIRIGILTIREKWDSMLDQQVMVLNQETEPTLNDALLFASNIIPTRAFVESVIKEQPDYEAVKIIQYPWHIFQYNDWALRQDFELVTKNRFSESVPETVHVTNAHNIFIEPGARLSHCILNASAGPIYIGRDTEIMEGASIRGPFALCEGAVVKMGARIYGATTIGPHCVVGGEIKNSVIFGYSNKAHDGYLGDAVVGEWCNLGAGTSNSNLKNNGSQVNVWHYASKEYMRAGIKCGLLMGDFSRSAINTAFNTGTVVGVCANVFTAGLTPKYIPDFSWGDRGLSSYEFEKALADIGNWKKFKNHQLTDEEVTRLRAIFEQS